MKHDVPTIIINNKMNKSCCFSASKPITALYAMMIVHIGLLNLLHAMHHQLSMTVLKLPQVPGYKPTSS